MGVVAAPVLLEFAPGRLQAGQVAAVHGFRG
jgi:hypothetical protein